MGKLSCAAWTTRDVLLLLSDLILAAELFNDLHFPLVGDVVWLTYGPAQALIVYAVNSALLVTGHRY
jgi:hypothetical protein